MIFQDPNPRQYKTLKVQFEPKSQAFPEHKLFIDLFVVKLITPDHFGAPKTLWLVMNKFQVHNASKEQEYLWSETVNDDFAEDSVQLIGNYYETFKLLEQKESMIKRKKEISGT